MLTFYLIALVIGGVLVGASVFFGGDADLDADVDADADMDADADVEADADGDGAHAPASGADGLSAWLPFGSIRFWTFFLTFGGLLGTLLTLFGLLGPVATALCSIAVGYLSGLGISVVVRRLRSDDVSSGVTERDLLGATGRVRLPVGPAQLGQVRVELKGRAVDLTAITEDPELGVERDVLVYAVRDDGVVVVTANPDTDQRNRRAS